MRGSGRLMARWVLGACMALAAGVLPWLWSEHREIRQVTGAWSQGQVDDFMRNWRNLDRRLQDAATLGDVVLRFEGFDASIPRHAEIVQQAAWRGAYAVYPRLVLVAEPGTVINNAADILAVRFNPSVQWMQEHDVRAVLHLTATGPEGFTGQLHVIPPGGR